MKFSVAAALFSFAATAYSQGISVISPGLGVEWKAGTTQMVTWSINSTAPAKTIQKLTLRGGASNNLDVAYIISNTAFDASTGKYEWAIDSKTETAVSYSVEVTTDTGSSYSPYFSIIGAAPGTTNNTLLGVQPGDKTSSASGSSTADADNAESSTETEDNESAASTLKLGALVGAVAAGTAVALF
ncbi:hypothetical protein BDB00DRAFT_818696 [Zychaea mexicana]|uniref:uncharacterized protein n=1 Tax=Zychaea mexicana TaxID=64656 RepID=UPI0022FE640B|nr:uncharacterized protein BDB00DRAFT_818696 [Zychaea mexicana]KAI9494316.1 hypothetical protein BDB00DRAFT_818696 [Zychaea mexicana]